MQSEEISLLANRASFAAYKRAKSSALVVNIVTISCLLVYYNIIPLNNFIINAYKLQWSAKLSAKLALEATCSLSSL